MAAKTSSTVSSSTAGVLQSGLDRGTLETWPVRCQTDKSSVPKPLLLRQLEIHLKKELRLLGCPPVGPHELRLQAHREVFECLIEKFTTYKPLLSAIKNEYELFISHQSEFIRELLPLQTKLHSLKDEYEHKIISLKEDDKKQDEKEREWNRQLQKDINRLTQEESSYKRQLKRLQEELGGIYEKYRFESDARKILIADFNDLKARQNDDQQDEEEIVEKEDPTILKLKLARAKEDLHVANKRINQVMADYGDVVPRREYELIESSYRKAESELDTVKAQYTSIMEEYNALLIMYKDVDKRRDKSMVELEQIKRSATPRPDWSRCGEFIEGGPEKWAEMSDGCSSDELVDVLLAQLAGVDINDILKREVFQGQGINESIPRYLQCEGEVTNRRIKRAEFEDLLSGFWEHWLLRISRGDTKDGLDEVLYQYLLARNEGVAANAIEDGYNIQDACGRFQHVLHVSLFSSILAGDMDDSIFVNWISMQVSLTERLKEICNSDNEVPMPQLEELLKSFFPMKTENMISSLVECAKHLATGIVDQSAVNVLQLMSKGPHHEPSPFVLMLLEQKREQNKSFVAGIKKKLGDKTDISLGEAKECIKSLDPNKPMSEIQQVMLKGFSSDDDQVVISTERFIKCLERADISQSEPLN